MKTKFTLFVIVFAWIGFGNVAKAQTPDWVWAKDTAAIAAGGMVTDASGNIYVINDFSDLFLIKYNNAGTKLWAKSAIGAQDTPPAVHSYPNSIALDLSGNILITGFFTSDSIVLESTIIKRVSTVDMFVAKYTSNGNLIWVKSAAIGNVGNVGFKIASDAAGDVLVVGSYSAASLTIGATTFTNPCTTGGGCPSMLVVKYAGSDGTVLWAKSSFAGIGTSYCYSVATDASNNIYVGGDFLVNRNGIVKYNSAGDTIWTQAKGGWYIATDAAGNLYSGYNKQANDGLVKKYNSSNGNLIWTSTTTGNANNKGVALTTDGAGNVYYFGTFKSTSITFGAFTLTHAGAGADDDFFIVKYDDTGTVLWAKAVGGTGLDALVGAATDVAGNVFVGGYFLSPTLSFGTTTLTILPLGYNAFFARLGSIVTGLDNAGDQEEGAIRLYPNPSNGKFSVFKDGVRGLMTIEVYNTLGEKILQQQLANELDLSAVAKGIYFVKMYEGATVYNQKVVVQ